jgi:hypothetical protein
MRMIYAKLFSGLDLAVTPSAWRYFPLYLDNLPATTEANSVKLKLASAMLVTYRHLQKLIRKQLGVVFVKVLFSFRSLVSQAVGHLLNLLVSFLVR